MNTTPSKLFLDYIDVSLKNDKIVYDNIYYNIVNGALDDFNPDFSSQSDREKINKIFSVIILSLCNYNSIDRQHRGVPIFALSEFKYKAQKLMNKISRFINIEFAPVFKKYRVYMKISVSDKIRYYQFNGEYFTETSKETFDEAAVSYSTNTDSKYVFLPLTEME